MNLQLEGVLPTLREMVRRFFAIRFDNKPIASADRFVEFVQTRAAYIAQTSLYGYLKARMGTRYTELFQDDKYVASIDIAKWRIYAACVSDLTIFATGLADRGKQLSDDQRVALARFCYETSIQNNLGEIADPNVIDEVIAEFDARLRKVNWDRMAEGENAFTQSPPDLVKWSPVVDEFKELDREIVINSIRFRWQDVREQLRKRIDGEAICLEWMKTPQSLGVRAPVVSNKG